MSQTVSDGVKRFFYDAGKGAYETLDSDRTVKENALDFVDQTKEGIMELTFEPEVLEFLDHLNGFFEIDWGSLITQVLLIGALGGCAYFAASAIFDQSIGKMIKLVTIVCCIQAVVTGVLE